MCDPCLRIGYKSGGGGSGLETVYRIIKFPLGSEIEVPGAVNKRTQFGTSLQAKI